MVKGSGRSRSEEGDVWLQHSVFRQLLSDELSECFRGLRIRMRSDVKLTELYVDKDRLHFDYILLHYGQFQVELFRTRIDGFKP